MSQKLFYCRRHTLGKEASILPSFLCVLTVEQFPAYKVFLQVTFTLNILDKGDAIAHWEHGFLVFVILEHAAIVIPVQVGVNVWVEDSTDGLRNFGHGAKEECERGVIISAYIMSRRLYTKGPAHQTRVKSSSYHDVPIPLDTAYAIQWSIIYVTTSYGWRLMHVLQ